MPYKNIEDKRESARRFYHNNKNKYDEYRKNNREKTRLWQKKYYERNKEEIQAKRKETYTEDNLRRTYGISLEEYNKIYKKQNYRCAICKSKKRGGNPESKLPLFVDHCHKTNEVRGLLCHWCNIMIGMAKDRKDILEKAIKYLC